jgi:CRP-like cAMP-binding protein
MEKAENELQTAVHNDLAARVLRGGRRPKVQKIKAGRVLVREGEPGKGMFLVLDGSLSLTVDGRQLAELGPGSVVGERAVVDAGLQTSTVPITVLVLQGPALAVGEREEFAAGKRTSTLTAVSDCRVIPLAPEDVDPEILRKLAEHHRREEAER